MWKGWWVFGEIENDSRKWFLKALEARDEQTLLLVIEKWIKLGTTIILDVESLFPSIYGRH